MRIGLVCQTYFSLNYGVSALNHAIISILCEILKNNYELVIFCQDENIENVKLNIESTYKIKNVEVLPIIQPKKLGTYFYYYNSIKSCDYILDTSLGDGFSDIYSKRKCYLQCILKEVPIILEKKLILLPQTIGPYYNNYFRKWAKRILKKSTAVFVRDRLSFDFCKKIYNANNLHLTSDMALMLPYSKSKYKINMDGKLKVGLNISGLLYNGGYRQNNQFNLKFDYKEFIKKIIEVLMIDSNIELFLIPHVFSKGIEDDYAVCNEIYQLFSLPNKPIYYESPMDVKSFISQMDVFIGSRMHSTIAAISANIPTIPIGYSRKFNGLFDQLQYKYYIDATETPLCETIDLVKKSINNISKLKHTTSNTQIIIENYNKELISKLSAVLGIENE